jgi:c-di-GMP-binding flagellar brake protein YcgR
MEVPGHSERVDERRRFFRIEDEITLFYREIEEDTLPDSKHFKDELMDVFSLTATLEYLDQESGFLQRTIEKSHPDIASYLDVLNQKIELIAKAVLLKEKGGSELPASKVNISASGVSFFADLELKKGTLLELKMILPPALTGLITYGKVVYCEPVENENHSHRLAVDYIDISEQDRDVLIRHIVKRQMQQIRKESDKDK